MRRFILVTMMVVVAGLGVHAALGVGNTPGTFMRDNAGGYFDACRVVRVVPIRQTFTYDPVTRVTLDTRERVTVDPNEGPPDVVVTTLAGLTC